MATTDHNVCQCLGRALNYPRYADDKENFPGATDADGVCVGEHVAETIAVEAAREIERLRAELLATPPTLEWLLSRIGKSSITKWHGVHDIHEWPCGIKWYRGHLLCVGPTGLTLMTRGCVEKVLAAMKEAAK